MDAGLRRLEFMTYKVVKFHTEKGKGEGAFQVAFNGDDRFFHVLDIHVSADLGPDALDYAELFGIWYFLMHVEMAGVKRTAKNLKLVVSRGAIKRLLRESSSKSHLFNYTNALRTQFYGLKDIEVEKQPSWCQDLQPTISTRWDGSPPPYPEVINPIVGSVGITYHAVERYFSHTNCEGRVDLIFQKVCKLVREASREVALPAKVLKHKSAVYGDDGQNVKYLTTPAGWQAVVSTSRNGSGLLLTIYQRTEF